MKALEAIVIIVIVVAIVIIVLTKLVTMWVSDHTVKSAKWVPMDPKVVTQGTYFEIEKRGQQPFTVAYVPHDDPDEYQKRSEAESLCIEKCAEWNGTSKLLRKWR